MRIFLEPTESLLFRTGRPFDAGESNYAESIFPPTPETIQGALRAAIATHWDTTKTLDTVFRDPKLVDLIGDRSGYGRFRITGMALGRRKKDNEHEIERLFPPPAYLFRDEAGTILSLRPEPMNGVQSILQQKADDGSIKITSYTMQYLLPDKKPAGKIKPITGWLPEESLYQVLQATPDFTRLQVVSPQNIYVREPRTGIGMQNTTKTTQEGLLYYMSMIRLYPEHGFVVDIRLSNSSDSDMLLDDTQTQNELHLPCEGWITLGGERRAARFEVIAPSTYEQGISVEGSKRGRLLYLATPTYFKGGWQPTSWPNSSHPIAAAVDRYKPIGGWLLSPEHSGGTQKLLRHCVPAGSVYFFDQSITVSQPLTDFGSHIGYGITYAGEWK